jgi:hypothetical protein
MTQSDRYIGKLKSDRYIEKVTDKHDKVTDISKAAKKMRKKT